MFKGSPPTFLHVRSNLLDGNSLLHSKKYTSRMRTFLFIINSKLLSNQNTELRELRWMENISDDWWFTKREPILFSI